MQPVLPTRQWKPAAHTPRHPARRAAVLRLLPDSSPGLRINLMSSIKDWEWRRRTLHHHSASFGDQLVPGPHSRTNLSLIFKNDP